jgi:hypothetical protein
MKNGVFWAVTPCGSCKNRRFGGTWRILHQGDKIGELGTTQAATSNRRTLRRNISHDVTTQKTLFFMLITYFLNACTFMPYSPHNLQIFFHGVFVL